MKKISLFIVSNTGTKSRQIALPSFVFQLSLFLLVVCLAGIGYGAYDYLHTKRAADRSERLEAKIADQSDIITGQHKQIQAFASEINELKAQLVTLNNFQEKIRIIANLDHLDPQDNFFGVGGSIPEDLDPGNDLTTRQSGLIREMHEQVNQLEMASIHQKEGISSLLEALEGQKNMLACTPAIRPAKGWKTSRFGYRTSPFTGRRELHKGLDIANRKGTKIIATADGLVKYTGKKGLLGNVLVIDHGHGFVTRYGHLKDAVKKRGDKVKRGDVIALMGNTGRSTGPHLHYEVLLNGVQVNPEKYILN
ncbi:MAG: M23 family metallopeptidase [Deltaproteobacteria bacterium]